MPIQQAQTFTLLPSPASPAPARCRITGQVARAGGGLRVSYKLEADLGCLRVPAPEAPRFADGLWRHTCFELFVEPKGEERYLEFNFSPSGEWALYRFARYRERIPLEGMSREAFAPGSTVAISAGDLQLTAVASLDELSLPTAAPLRVAIAAVIEAADGTLSYWALGHPAPKPDFHHPDARVLEF